MRTEVECPECRARFAADVPAGGGPVPCTVCGRVVFIPPEAVPLVPLPAVADHVVCAACGERNVTGAGKCARCGAVLVRGPGSDQADTVSGLVPYHNPWALSAYYLGVFALIPCVGVPLGVVSVGLGIAGVRYARRRPAARGGAHAWAGVVLGVLSVVGNLALAVILAAL